MRWIWVSYEEEGMVGVGHKVWNKFVNLIRDMILVITKFGDLQRHLQGW